MRTNTHTGVHDRIRPHRFPHRTPFGMSEFVIKYWRCGTKPVDEQGNYVHIVGRRAGSMGTLLTLLRIDPSIKLLIGLDRIELRQASLMGISTRMIPLESLSSSFYGQHKPWKRSLLLLLGFGVLALSVLMDRSDWVTALSLLVAGVVVATMQYLLHQSLLLGLQEMGGHQSVIRFRPCFLDNVDIDEQQARQVCKIVQRLADAKRKRLMLTAGSGR